MTGWTSGSPRTAWADRVLPAGLCHANRREGRGDRLNGEPVGSGANAVTWLSLDPPLLLVCFDLGSATLRAIRSHGGFIVNARTAR